MNRSGVWIGSVLAVIAVVAVLVLSSQQTDGLPFDAESTAPDGYAALSMLLRDRGDQVSAATATEVATRSGWGPEDVLVVPVPSYANREERDSFAAAARAGATVVYGEPVADGAGDSGAAEEIPFDSYWLDARTLADTPAAPVRTDICDMDELDGLGPIDAAFAGPVAVGPGDTSCYGTGESALFQSRPVGAGSLVTLGSPYLWVNARLQPAKEIGGAPLDNAATALRILAGEQGELGTAGRSTRITMVDARPSPGAPINGSRDPLELLPVPVKLALVQLVAAFGIFVWWRSRRLGRPGAGAHARRDRRIRARGRGRGPVAPQGEPHTRGLRPARRGPHHARLPPRRATLGAGRRAQLAGRPSHGQGVRRGVRRVADGPVADSDALVRLARTLDSIRQEVLDVPVLR